jgi:hypothetical protein
MTPDALAHYSDEELDELFVEAERNALAWSELAVRGSEHRAGRWMEIAAAYRAEIARRALSPKPSTSKNRRARSRRLLAKAVARIITARTAWSMREARTERIVANPPATKPALRARAAASPHPLPPSYLDLLELHDGIAGFYGIDGELVSSSYRGEHDEQWRDSTQLADCPELANLVFFAMDSDGSAASFDATTRDSRGEMQVIEIRDYRELERFDSLASFLITFAERMESWIEAPIPVRDSRRS